MKKKINEYFEFTVPISGEIQAASNETEPASSVPKFHIIAYTGEAMVPSSWSDPVVIDLEGVSTLNDKIPIRMNHDRSCGIGHATNVYVKDGALQADGLISRDTEYARDVVNSALNDYPWQISVGGQPIEAQFYDEGTSFSCNGKTFNGPITLVTKFELREMSFCDLGADHRTSAEISASLNDNDLNADFNGDTMENTAEKAEVAVENVQTASGEIVENAEPIVEETVAEPVAETPVEEKPAEVAACKSEPTPVIVKVEQPAVTATRGEDFYRRQERNANRISAINSVDAEGFEELRAQAIEEGWSFNDFNTALKAARHDKNIVEARELPKTNAMSKNTLSDKAIEAALVINTLGDKFAEKHFSEEDLNRADDARRKLSCFRDVFAYATNAPFYRDDLNDMSMIQAAFTTSSLEKIFRNVVNKSMLAGYETVSSVWRKICSVSRAPDFKPIYSYRNSGDFTYKEVDSNDGELSNATFSEQEYTNEVSTYGLKFSLTRKMLYNDDLNALTSLPRQLGEGAGNTLNDKVFELLLSNPNDKDGNAFFSTNHANYETTAGSVDSTLSIASLGRATLMFESQTTPEGRPIAQTAKTLLLPTALKLRAMNIMNSTMLNETTNVYDPQGVMNPLAGMYEVVATPYLSSPKFGANASASGWYLFGDPNRISCIDVVFLNGVEQPTIQQGDVEFDRLGIQYRGVFDFGIALQDYRGAVFFDA